MYQLEIYFFIFMVYAFIGWIVEVICKLLTEHRFINRGFLIGPYCPIYGWGSLIMTLLLTQYQKDIVVLFVMAVLWCCILEYLTSYVMEKLFKARWWDYTETPFNINGRICLLNAILFGMGGTIIIKIINPILLPFIENIPFLPMHILCSIFFLIFLIDVIISCGVITKFSKTAKFVVKDSTEEISKVVRKNTADMREKVIKNVKKLQRDATIQLKKLYNDKNILHRRLLSAFPNLEVRNIKAEKVVKKFMKKMMKKEED